jgi:hypothetical protein
VKRENRFPYPGRPYCPQRGQRRVQVSEDHIPSGSDFIGDALSVESRKAPPFFGSRGYWRPRRTGWRGHGETACLGVIQHEIGESEHIGRPLARLRPRVVRGERLEVRGNGRSGDGAVQQGIIRAPV